LNENEKNGKYLSRFFKLSAVLCLITLFLCCSYNSEELYIPVSISSATTDPDGYLNGKWNIWEFIGDFFSGILE